MTKTKNSGLSKIYKDNTSGSGEILKELHEHLRGEQKMLELFPALITEIKLQFKSFQSVQHYLAELDKYIKLGKKLDEFFKKYDSLLNNIYLPIYEKNKKELKKLKNILTISNSKTILEISKLIKKDNGNLKVTICESRPKFEGRLMAKKLAALKIDVELIIDTDLFSRIKNIDAVLIGADMILKNGNVVNKTGSATLAVLCKHFAKPFYVIADRSKFSSQNKFEQKEMPPEEIWRHSNSKIKISNFYFEEIDKKLITKIFTS